MYPSRIKKSHFTQTQNSANQSSANLSNSQYISAMESHQTLSVISSIPDSNAAALQMINGDTIQKRDDTAKLRPAQIGADPTGIGLTCHHVIPAGMLENFYNLCSGITNIALRKKFQLWAAAAKRSTEQTQALRDPLIGQNYDASSAQWMCGNIFIGPDANARIDDLHDEDTFDYAAQRKTYQNFVPDEKKEGIKISLLRDAYNHLLVLFAAPVPDRAAMTGHINSILDALIVVAKDTSTLHKEVANAATPAYNTADWYSVGIPAIPGMVNMQPQFAIITALYTTYQGIRGQTDKQAAYVREFRKYINITFLPSLGIRHFTISKHNYELLKAAYDAGK